MFRDTRLSSDVARRDREAKGLIYRLSKADEKHQKKFEAETKDALIDYYRRAYGINVSDQQRFILNPKRLRELLLRKATSKIWDTHARRLQKWWRGRLGRAKFLNEVRTARRACITIQRQWRHYCKWFLHVRKQVAAMKTSSSLLGRYCKGYLARRRGLKMMADHKIKLLYEEYHRIDVIVKGHFQRRVRKVWLAYKEKKAAKARKKKEAAAAKKKKGYRGYTKKVDPKPATTVAKPPAQKPAEKKPSPADTNKTSAADVKQVSTDPTDPLANTTIDISLNRQVTELTTPDRLMATVGATAPIDEENRDLDGPPYQLRDADGNIVRIAQGSLGEELGGALDDSRDKSPAKLNEMSGDGSPAKEAGMGGGDYFDEAGMFNRQISQGMDLNEDDAMGS